MAFVTIDSNAIQVGDPIRAELFVQIKDSLDDLDARVTAAAAGTGKIQFINDDIIIGSTATSALESVVFIEVLQDSILTEAAIQLFLKSPATTGSLTVDIKTNSSTNPTGFNSIFSTLPTLNFTTATDYQRQSGIINPTYQSVSVGDIIRLSITSLPAGLQKFRMVLVGEI